MRIVVKVGTSTLAYATGRLNIQRVERMCKVLSDLKNAGHEIILVSSGAIAMGFGKLNLQERPKDMPTKQASAAVGQCELMYVYDKLFTEYNHTVAQLLITAPDIADGGSRKENFHNTLDRLLELGALPVINENDTISTEEIAVGDNDTLSAVVAATVQADLLIPRGGAGLIRACVEHATVPCIQTGTGICHVYVDEFADLDKAARIIVNAKTSRPSVCNAEEVCLVHSAVAAKFLPMLRQALVEDRRAAGQVPVELRLDTRAAEVIPGTPAGPADFDTEFLDYILAVKVVDSVDEAIAHILAHSTHHSEAIVTENAANAEKFVNETDSAAVYVNVSTRFTDGGEFGLGCEMGISTQKLHARGPMGLDELSTYKYIVRGNGQTR